MSGKYDDIIHLPHYEPKIHPRMSALNRAAQFTPFAALTGYEATIREAARQTQQKVDLSDDERSRLNEKLRFLADMAAAHPAVTISYFLPDERKAGGEYVSLTGTLKRINDHDQVVSLLDGKTIPFQDVYDIDCELFRNMED